MAWQLKKWVLALATCSSLAACGGGGGGGDAGAGVPPGSGGGQLPGSAVTLTEANMESLARNALDAMDIATTVSSSGASLLGGIEISGSAQKVQWPVWLARQGLALLNRAPMTGGLVGGVVISKTEPCRVGGTIEFTVDDADNTSNVSKGDTLSAQFNNCSETADGVAAVVNGGFSLLLGDVTGSIDAGNGIFNMAMTMPAPGLSIGVNEGGKLVTTTVTGEMNMNLQLNGGNTATITRSNGFSASTSDGETIGYSNFLMLFSDTPTLSSFSIDSDISASGKNVTGAYTLNMSRFGLPLNFARGNNYPASGELRIGGANGTLTLTVQPNAMALLTLNADGKTASKSVGWCTIGNC